MSRPDKAIPAQIGSLISEAGVEELCLHPEGFEKMLSGHSNHLVSELRGVRDVPINRRSARR